MAIDFSNIAGNIRDREGNRPTRPTQQQQNVYQQAADTMREAGIRSLSGRTTSTPEGREARDIQRDYLADVRPPGSGQTIAESIMLDRMDFPGSRSTYKDELGAGNILETKGDPLKQSIVSNILRGKPPRETGIFGLDTSGLKLPSIGPVLGSLEGLKSTDTFFKNLATKGAGGLSSKDKVTLINLINRLGTSPESIENLLQTYADKNEVSADVLASDFNKAYNKIGSDVLSSGIIDYFDTKPEGFKESLSAMFGQFEGDKVPGQVLELEDPDLTPEYGLVARSGMVDRPTLQDVTSKLGTEGLQFLKVTNPQAYYSLRPNDPDLANESFVSTGDRVADRRFNAKIMEARAEAMNRQSRQDANMGQGIMAASPALPGLPVRPPITPPGTTPPAQPPIPAPIAGVTPFNINQFYASLPQYTQQGIMSPNLSQFYQNLGLFPGMNV